MDHWLSEIKIIIIFKAFMYYVSTIRGSTNYMEISTEHNPITDLIPILILSYNGCDGVPLLVTHVDLTKCFSL